LSSPLLKFLRNSTPFFLFCSCNFKRDQNTLFKGYTGDIFGHFPEHFLQEFPYKKTFASKFKKKGVYFHYCIDAKMKNFRVGPL